MSVRDLFRLMLKLFGLYTLLSSLFTVPFYIGLILFEFNWFYVLGAIALGLAMIAFFFYLVFRPDPIIDMLRLPTGFDQDHISFDRIDAVSLTRIGVVVIGGFFFLRNIGSALVNLYTLFHASVASTYDRESDFVMQKEPRDLVINLISVAISWLLITNATRVARFLASQEKGESEIPADSGTDQ